MLYCQWYGTGQIIKRIVKLIEFSAVVEEENIENNLFYREKYSGLRKGKNCRTCDNGHEVHWPYIDQERQRGDRSTAEKRTCSFIFICIFLFIVHFALCRAFVLLCFFGIRGMLCGYIPPHAYAYETFVGHATPIRIQRVHGAKNNACQWTVRKRESEWVREGGAEGGESLIWSKTSDRVQ